MMIDDRQFIEVDLMLRRGAHVNRSNLAAYEWMADNFDELSSFYARYGCGLHRHQDGFFYMTTTGGQIRSRMLPKSCVHMGLFLALKARDPEILRSSGRISLTALLQDIETSVPKETLRATYAPRSKEGLSDEKIVDELKLALKILDELNFIELTDGMVRPLEALARFSEVSKHNNDPDDGARMVMELQKGIVFQVAHLDTWGNENVDPDAREPNDEATPNGITS